MKRRIATVLTLSSLALANVSTVFAQLTINPVQPAGGGIAGGTTPQTLLNNVITIIFSVGILLVLFFLILGAFNWITSGGDKEKIKGARGTIVHALIGLAILALSFVIITVAGQILHIDFTNLSLPTLSD